MDIVIRPMQVADVEEAERVSDAAFLALEVGLRRVEDPAPRGRSAERQAAWVARTEHYLRTDPGGCWVAERDDQMVGFATSLRRDLTWILATYAVRPGLQGNGIGRPLLDAAITHGRNCLRGMLAASDDPRAFRRYRAAGFSMHPQLLLEGRIDRTALPVVEHVREGNAADVDLMDSIDRRVRDAAHGPDHLLLLSQHRLVVVERSTGSGYVYVDGRGQPALLAATNRRTAAALLWEALASAPAHEEVAIAHVTSANEWAVDVGLTARLSVRTSGFLALRGMKPPVPYVHHGTCL